MKNPEERRRDYSSMRLLRLFGVFPFSVLFFLFKSETQPKKREQRRKSELRRVHVRAAFKARLVLLEAAAHD